MRALALHIAILVVAGWLAHVAQREADRVRLDEGADSTLYVPSPEALRVASLGQPGMVADYLWVDAVLRFMDIFEGDEPGGHPWLFATLDSVATLDPGWRTVYFYGGSMLRVLDEIEASDQLYRRGMEALPDDPFFPFSLGMNAYLYRNDPMAAHRFLDQAAALPGAPPWYRAAAAAFLDHEGERRAALRYLGEELEGETRPRVRDALEARYRDLLHDERAEQIEERRSGWEDRHGRRLDDLEVLAPLPPDPYGEGWILAVDGVVRSRARDEVEARKARTDERAMLTRGARSAGGATP